MEIGEAAGQEHVFTLRNGGRGGPAASLPLSGQHGTASAAQPARNTSWKLVCTPTPVVITLFTFLSWMVGKVSYISQICGTSSTSSFVTSVKLRWRVGVSTALRAARKSSSTLGLA